MKRIRKGQGKIVVLAPEESMFTMSNMVHFHNELKNIKYQSVITLQVIIGLFVMITKVGVKKVEKK